MKWFKVDSNTPDDPKIQTVIAELGNAGLGMLFRLWCYVAAHGTKEPGLSCDSQGRKIPKSVLARAIGGSDEEFDRLACLLARTDHVSKKRWKANGVLFFPAMSKRADVYSQRRVRTLSAQSAKFVPVEEKRREEILLPARSRTPGNGHLPKKKTEHDRQYWTVYRLAIDLLGQRPVRDKLDPVSIKEELKKACARKNLNYSGDVVGRALDAALVARAKVGK